MWARRDTAGKVRNCLCAPKWRRKNKVYVKSNWAAERETLILQNLRTSQVYVIRSRIASFGLVISNTIRRKSFVECRKEERSEDSLVFFSSPYMKAHERRRIDLWPKNLLSTSLVEEVSEFGTCEFVQQLNEANFPTSRGPVAMWEIHVNWLVVNHPIDIENTFRVRQNVIFMPK